MCRCWTAWPSSAWNWPSDRAKCKSLPGSGERAGRPRRAGPHRALQQMAQTVRRTLALKTKLAEASWTSRPKLAAQRAERRDTLDRAYRGARDAGHQRHLRRDSGRAFPTSTTRRMNACSRTWRHACSATSSLATMWTGRWARRWPGFARPWGLDPALCFLDGETWKMCRPPYNFEAARQAKADPSVEPCLRREPLRGDRAARLKAGQGAGGKAGLSYERLADHRR